MCIFCNVEVRAEQFVRREHFRNKHDEETMRHEIERKSCVVNSRYLIAVAAYLFIIFLNSSKLSFPSPSLSNFEKA